jgi:hypothetical protein
MKQSRLPLALRDGNNRERGLGAVLVAPQAVDEG